MQLLLYDFSTASNILVVSLKKVFSGTTFNSGSTWVPNIEGNPQMLRVDESSDFTVTFDEEVDDLRIFLHQWRGGVG